MEPFIGEITMFAGTFEPKGWFFCDGRLLSVDAYPDVFSILGSTYGGDGRTDFALPDLRERAAVHAGKAQGLTVVSLGEAGGDTQVSLRGQELPTHKHQVNCTTTLGTQDSPQGAIPAAENADGANIWADSPTNEVGMKNSMVQSSGEGQPMDIRSPALAVNFIIAVQGIYPPKS